MSPPSGVEARENLVVRRILCSERVDEEPVLRRSLFKTRCKMAGNFQKLIINIRSLEILTSRIRKGITKKRNTQQMKTRKTRVQGKSLQHNSNL